MLTDLLLSVGTLGLTFPSRKGQLLLATLLQVLLLPEEATFWVICCSLQGMMLRWLLWMSRVPSMGIL